MVRQIVHNIKALLNEERRPFVDWVQVVPVGQCTLNYSYSEWCQACLVKVVLGREP